PDIVLVPLRPAPATNRTLRGYVAASVRLSSLAGCVGPEVTRRKPNGGYGSPMVWSRRGSALLSVVVPAYDVAAYLPACLDSVLAQAETLGRTGLQVIVVDDGSPDDVGAI